MLRRVWLTGLGVLLFVGCDQGPRVERKRVEDPVAGPAVSAPDAASPHAKIPTGAAKDTLGPEVSAGMVALTAPQGWVRKTPSSGFLQAEFALPKAEGDPADARLTVSLAGGDIQANIARWRGQFSDKPAKDAQEHLDVGGVAVTLVDMSGTFADQRGMMGPVTNSPNFRLLGAIFEVGGQMHFIKCYGPEKTITARADEFKAFVRSIKKKS